MYIPSISILKNLQFWERSTIGSICISIFIYLPILNTYLFFNTVNILIAFECVFLYIILLSFLHHLETYPPSILRVCKEEVDVCWTLYAIFMTQRRPFLSPNFRIPPTLPNHSLPCSPPFLHQDWDSGKSLYSYVPIGIVRIYLLWS